MIAVTNVTNLDECAAELAKALGLARLCRNAIDGNDEQAAGHEGLELLIDILRGLYEWMDNEAQRRGEGTYGDAVRNG